MLAERFDTELMVPSLSASIGALGDRPINIIKHHPQMGSDLGKS